MLSTQNKQIKIMDNEGAACATTHTLLRNCGRHKIMRNALIDYKQVVYNAVQFVKPNKTQFDRQHVLNPHHSLLYPV